jgi:hypothetical protein
VGLLFDGVPERSRTRICRLTTVCNDHYFSSLQVMRECHRLGYRRVGLVQLSSHQQRFHGRWEAGLLIAQRYLGDMQLTSTPRARLVDGSCAGGVRGLPSNARR